MRMLLVVTSSLSCGEGGIRTPGTVARTPHFECGPIDHSGTSPFRRGRRISPLLPIQNRCFGTANIDIFFVSAHFCAKKITFASKKAFRDPLAAAFSDLFVPLAPAKMRPTGKNDGKFAFAGAYSYLCQRTDPPCPCSIFRVRPFIRVNDTKTGTVFVCYMEELTQTF